MIWNRRQREKETKSFAAAAEIEKLRGAAMDRTRTIESKSSFLVAGAGILAGAIFVPAVQSDSHLWFPPIALAFSAIAAACIALRPMKLDVPSASLIYEAVAKSTASSLTLRDWLTRVTVVEVGIRNAQNKLRNRALRIGFGFLFASVLLAMGATAVELL